MKKEGYLVKSFDIYEFFLSVVFLNLYNDDNLIVSLIYPLKCFWETTINEFIPPWQISNQYQGVQNF